MTDWGKVFRVSYGIGSIIAIIISFIGMMDFYTIPHLTALCYGWTLALAVIRTGEIFR